MPAFQNPEYKASQPSKSKGFKNALSTMIDRLFGVKKNVGSRISKTKKNIEDYIKEIDEFLSFRKFQR